MVLALSRVFLSMFRTLVLGTMQAVLRMVLAMQWGYSLSHPRHLMVHVRAKSAQQNMMLVL